MNKATRRATRMVKGLAGVHGHRLGRYHHDMATVRVQLHSSRCQHGCGAESYVYTDVVKGKSRVKAVAHVGIRKGCDA